MSPTRKRILEVAPQTIGIYSKPCGHLVARLVLLATAVGLMMGMAVSPAAAQQRPEEKPGGSPAAAGDVTPPTSTVIRANPSAFMILRSDLTQLSANQTSVATQSVPFRGAAGPSRPGVCEKDEFWYYHNSNHRGSISDFTRSLKNYGTNRATCGHFISRGTGQNHCIKNDAASVWNRTNHTVVVYYNSNYKGLHQQSIRPGAKINLTTLKNQNASHKFLATPRPPLPPPPTDLQCASVGNRYSDHGFWQRDVHNNCGREITVQADIANLPDSHCMHIPAHGTRSFDYSKLTIRDSYRGMKDC